MSGFPDKSSLYVHVPFCAVKCGYCDFTSYVPEDSGALDAYLEGLRTELDLRHPAAPPPTIFLGGGTPTYLDPPRLRQLLEIVDRVAPLHGCVEVTMEANPESVTEEKLRLARRLGVNRLSLGAQSFDDRRLAFLDRPHDAAAIERAVAAARAAGFDNVSLDLIFGLPGQTLDDWRCDLEHALVLGPDHLSCYALTFEPGTRFTRLVRRGDLDPPSDEIQRDMLLFTRERLGAAGFTAYEISNFAGRGGPCLHNDRYWQQADYVGVGPGAASHRAGVRSTNLKALGAWLDRLRRGTPPVAETETLTPLQRAAEALWLGLRRSEGVDLTALSARLGFDVPARFAGVLEDLVRDGLIDRTATHIRCTPQGVLFADEAGARFLAAAAATAPPEDVTAP